MPSSPSPIYNSPLLGFSIYCRLWANKKQEGRQGKGPSTERKRGQKKKKQWGRQQPALTAQAPTQGFTHDCIQLHYSHRCRYESSRVSIPAQGPTEHVQPEPFHLHPHGFLGKSQEKGQVWGLGQKQIWCQCAMGGWVTQETPWPESGVSRSQGAPFRSTQLVRTLEELGTTVQSLRWGVGSAGRG